MDWKYDSWPSGEPYNWGGAERGTHPLDQIDFHVDLGCGTGVKKGRIGVDQFAAPGVDIVANLDECITYAASVGGPGGPVIGAEGNHVARAPSVRLLDPRVLQVPVLAYGLPFETSSIKSIVSHHCLEHIGTGFIALIEEVYRVLEPDGIFRVITPLFPSRAAVDDPTHVRYFTETTWEFCCGKPGETHWMESFSVPYTSARFEKVHQDVTALAPPNERWKDDDAREIRVALKANK